MTTTWLAEGPAATPWPDGALRWHGLDGAPDRAYVEATRAPGAGWQPLTLLNAMDGASHGQPASHHYVVETDVAPAHEQEFNAWYTQEHLPGLARVPGTIRAARFQREGSPRYLACYHLTSPEVLHSAPWLAVRHTDWSSRVRPLFLNTRRLMFRAA